MQFFARWARLHVTLEHMRAGALRVVPAVVRFAPLDSGTNLLLMRVPSVVAPALHFVPHVTNLLKAEGLLFNTFFSR